MKDNKSPIEEYWWLNFSNPKVVESSDDLQLNIARTKNGIRVQEEVWKNTLDYIRELLSIDKESKVLELCCGNGVIIGVMATYCKYALGIDYSQKLLNQLKRKYKNKNLEIICDDVNEVDIQNKKFEAIIIYFSIQHFTEREAFLLIKKSINSLSSNGKILIGDIPDIDKKWSYINKSEYRMDYFQRLEENRPKIGYWYKRDFFKAMESIFPSCTISTLSQPDYQINSDHCFDVLISRNNE